MKKLLTILGLLVASVFTTKAANVTVTVSNITGNVIANQGFNGTVNFGPGTSLSVNGGNLDLSGVSTLILPANISGNHTFTGNLFSITIGNTSDNTTHVATDAFVQAAILANPGNDGSVSNLSTSTGFTVSGNGSGMVSFNGLLNLGNIAQGGATSGQALVWNGTHWAAATVSGGNGSVSNLTTSTGFTISGNGTSTLDFDGLLNLGNLAQGSATSGQVLAWNGTRWAPSTVSGVGTVTSVALSTNTGLTISGSPITGSGTFVISGLINPGNIAQGGATSGQALVWNGTAYAPATVSGGNGSVSNLSTSTGFTVSGNGSGTVSFNGLLNPGNISQDSATTGQAIVWNGTAWAPGTVATGGNVGGNTTLFFNGPSNGTYTLPVNSTIVGASNGPISGSFLHWDGTSGNWGNTLLDFSGFESFDSNNRVLHDSHGATDINWSNGLIVTGYNVTLSSGTWNHFQLTPTYDETTGTANNTDLLINRTETAVGSGAQNFENFEVGGTPKWTVSHNGSLALGKIPTSTFTTLGGSASAGQALLYNSGNTDYEPGTILGTITNYSGSTGYSSGQIAIGSDSNFYRAIASTTGNDPTTDAGTHWQLYDALSNVTLAVPSRFSTIATAMSFIQSAIISAGDFVTIQVANGNYTYGTTTINLQHPYGNQIQILGNLTSPSSVQINSSIVGTTGPGLFYLFNGGQFGLIDGMTLIGPGANVTSQVAGVGAANNAQINLGPNMYIGNFYFEVYASNGAFVVAAYDHLFGGGDGDLFVYNNSGAQFNNGTATLANTYFSESGVVVEHGSSVFAIGANLSNNNGNGVLVDNSSSINLEGAVLNNNTGAPMTVSSSSIDVQGATWTSNGNSNKPILLGWAALNYDGYEPYNPNGVSGLAGSLEYTNNLSGYGGMFIQQGNNTSVGTLGVGNGQGTLALFEGGGAAQTVRSAFGQTGNFSELSGFGTKFTAIDAYDNEPLLLGTNQTLILTINSSASYPFTITSASNTTGAVVFGSTGNFAGILTASATTSSTTTTSGAIVDAGGLGVAGNLTLGGLGNLTSGLSVTGNSTLAGTFTINANFAGNPVILKNSSSTGFSSWQFQTNAGTEQMDIGVGGGSVVSTILQNQPYIYTVGSTDLKIFVGGNITTAALTLNSSTLATFGGNISVGNLVSSGAVNGSTGNFSAGFTLQSTLTFTGTNKGTFTLVAGTAAVSNTNVTANSLILITMHTPGGSIGLYNPMISSKSSGTFTVTTLATDTSTYDYLIIN